MVNYIICELNPLHNGHARLIRAASALPDSEGTVCIMSSHLVQRGEFPITDKWTRAAMALESGADLVIELSAPFSGAAAPQFAKGGVLLAKATGLCGRLCFGTEGESLAALQRMAQIDPQTLDTEIQKHLQSGKSFAAALGTAYETILPDSGALLQTPNNLLGLEYIKAIQNSEAPLTPWALPRNGAAHDEKNEHIFPSATLVREKIQAKETLSDFIPAAALSHLAAAVTDGRILDKGKADVLCLSFLRSLSLADWAAVPGTEEGLAERFYKFAGKAGDIEQLLDLVKTKRFTHARLRRIAMHAYLGLGDTLPLSPAYLRVLGIGTKGKTILRKMKQTASLPILTKTADNDMLSAEGKKLLAAEARVTDRFMFSLRVPKETGKEFTTSPIVIKGAVKKV